MRYSPNRLASRYAVLLLLALFSAQVSAGFFSTLSKIGKSVGKADVDIPLNKLELPDSVKGLSPAGIKHGADGQWEITLTDGRMLSVDELLRQSLARQERPVLLMQARDMPRDLHDFDGLPGDWPLLIQGKGERLFELHRGDGTALGYGHLRLPVDNIGEIRDGLWQLQRPAAAGGVRFLSMDSKLLDLMRESKHQTLVLSGRIVDGRLLGTDKKTDGVALQSLYQLAAERDIQLVILESERPQALLKRLAAESQQTRGGVAMLYDTVGDFFNRLVDPANPSPLELRSFRSGEQQLAIQWRTVPLATDDASKLSLEMVQHLPLHLLLQSSTLLGPDEMRSRELEHRIVPNVPSWIQFHIIISVVLGVTAVGTSWRLWNKLWALRARREYPHLLLFLLLWPLHRLLFVMWFLPLFGGLSFLWLLISSIYGVFNFLLFRPLRWAWRRLAISA